MRLYALAGDAGPYTHRGRLIVHPDADEMLWLFPHCRAMDVTGTADPTLPLQRHPDLSHIRWPLQRGDFR